MAAAGCGYVETAAIHELTQGIRSANQLMLNLHSANARESLIPKILTSYHKAFSVLMHGDSGGQLLAPVPSAASAGFVFDQPFLDHHRENVVSRKRKGSTIQENRYTKSLTKQVPTTNEIRAVASTYQPHQPSTPDFYESLMNLNGNLSVHTSDSASDIAYSFGDSITTSLSSSSISFGLSEDSEQHNFQNHNDDELMQACLPFISPDDELMQAYLQFNSPTTPKSTFFPEWESSDSLDFLIDPTDVYLDFELINYVL